MDLIYILLDTKPNIEFSIKGEVFKYLVKVRRHNEGDEINFRSCNDLKILYSYKINSIDNRSLEVELINSKIQEVKAKKSLRVLIFTGGGEGVFAATYKINLETADPFF